MLQKLAYDAVFYSGFFKVNLFGIFYCKFTIIENP